jgi:hypothetical protein
VFGTAQLIAFGNLKMWSIETQLKFVLNATKVGGKRRNGNEVQRHPSFVEIAIRIGEREK